MNQSVIDRAVNIATKSALDGHPVRSIVWVPPVLASQDTRGTFIVEYASPIPASQTQYWEM